MVEQLDAIGFVWFVGYKVWFPECLEHLEVYKREHGDCRVPFLHICPDGYPLGRQVNGIRTRRKGTSDGKALIPSMIAQLDKIGFIWDDSVKGRWFSEFIKHLREFNALHGHGKVPSEYSCPDGYKLGGYADRIRSGRATKKGNVVTSEMVNEIDRAGFIWDANRQGKWFPYFLLCMEAYKKEFGDCCVHKGYTCPDGYKLGQRVQSVRNGYHSTGSMRISPEMVSQLEALGFIWGVR